MATDAWGIDDGYLDASGSWHEAGAETVAALRAAMRTEDGRSPVDQPVKVVRRDEPMALAAPALLTLEDGTELPIEHGLPPDVPLGYHRLRSLHGDSDRQIRLIVSPGRCHLPQDLRTWGAAVQLYAARSARSWGMGDLGDLRTIAEWTTDRGAGVLAVNPLHAATPITPQEASPYFPSSRRWSDPLYLRIENVPGAAEEPEIAELAAAGRALNHERRIDRDAVWVLKRAALDRLWRRFPGDPSFDRFVTDNEADLTEFSTFCALAEQHGTGWRSWPAEHRAPDSDAVSAFAARHRDRVRFHAWLQWLVDRQLTSAGADDVLIADLAVGIDPDGADAWSGQDILALDVRVGAPPDEFNTQGQDWGLPPFIPWRLRAAGYEPFLRTMRAGMRRARGIRIDHVMGLFRLFWIPPGAAATAGAYVRFPERELLDIVALESVRAGAFVVGEDLGTVENEVRWRLAAAGVLSYRLVWFESIPPEEYPVQALAAVTTHDLPTVAGLWSGSDLGVQERLDLHPNTEGTAQMHAQLAALTGADDTTSVDDVVVAAHQRLTQAPSMLVTATLDDMLAVEERPNMPGTVDVWPNWCLALPQPIEALPDHPLARRVVDALAARPDDRAP